MACATYHAAPPYPTVVAVKLIAVTKAIGGVSRKMLDAGKKTNTCQAPRQHERQRHADTADKGDEACTSVH